MAKQSSLFKLRGKADGQSFYYSKNGEYLTRKINPGMSSRVKTAKEYANTRLNNAEFGAAGACAGAMVRAVSSRWRYILNSIATGMLVKGIKEAMMQDTTSVWGKRLVSVADMPAIQSLYNGFSKNPMVQAIVDQFNNDATIDTTSHEFEIAHESVQDADFVSRMNDIGATDLQIDLYAFNVSAPKIGADGESYAEASYILGKIHSYDIPVALGDDLIGASTYSDVPNVFNETTHFGGVLVIFKPCRKVGGMKNILQQHCSAYWTSIKIAE